MTKIVHVKEEEGKHVDRVLVQKLGNAVYSDPDVGSVFIKVYFKDGSLIGFRRDEEEEEAEALHKEREKERKG